MSYLVLARKYRPKTFTEMVGQDHVVRALTNALQTQRLHHAYLFTGTRGVGKTTVSRILAKSLNCIGLDGAGGITAAPCGQCQACLDIDAGRFVDYIELDAASNRGVEEISRLLEQAVYKPVAGRFKVFMIDEVHMLSNTAFNAMLKTLEEPPDYLKFVLATTDPQKVPVTVLSRCLQFNLRPMAPETVYEHLNQVLAAEGISIDSGSLHMLSRAAHGSMRDALSLTDQAISYGNGVVEISAVRQMLGAVDRSYVFDLMNALATGDGKTVVQRVNFMREHGLSASAALEEMINVLQQITVVQFAPQVSPASGPDADHTNALAKLFAADELQLLYSIVLRGQDELGLASDEYAALMMILLRYMAFTGQKKNDANTVKPAIKTDPTEEQPKSRQESVLNPASLSEPATQPNKVENRVETPQQKIDRVDTIVKDVSAPPIEPLTEPLITSENKTPHQAPAFESAAKSDLNPNADKTEKNIPMAQPAQVDEIPPWLDEPLPQEEENSAAAAQKTDAIEKMKSAGQNLPPLQPGTDASDRWFEIVMLLEQQELLTALTRELAMNSQAQNMMEGEKSWVLYCDRQTLLQENNQRKLVQIVTDLLGHPVNLVFELNQVTDTPSLRIKQMEQQKLAQALLHVEADPDVQKLLQQFPGARIVPGSVKAL